MEQTSSPNIIAPQPPQVENKASAVLPQKVEQGRQVSERAVASPEQGIPPQAGAAQPYLTPVVTPPPVHPVAQDNGSSPSDDAATLQIANDVDVIEKEWVDKAKSIVAATHDDPYQQEKQVNELQNSYLKKRYGKDVGIAKE